MADTSMLRQAIKGRGVSYKHMSSVLGVSEMTLARKLKNQSEFKASEISAVCRELHLSDKERNDIFFAPHVE